MSVISGDEYAHLMIEISVNVLRTLVFEKVVLARNISLCFWPTD